jgi:hypothetical protein
MIGGAMLLKISQLTSHPLKWVQPSLRMEYELLTVDTLVATLQFRSAWGTLAYAESGDGNWTFKRIGFWQKQASIRVNGVDEDIAIFTNNTWSQGGTLEFNNGRRFKATTNFWMTQLEWETEDEQPLIRFHIGGFCKQSAEVEILPEAARLPELPILVLFGWYLILMLHRDSAAASAAASSYIV